MYPIGLVPVGFGLVRSHSVTVGQSRSQRPLGQLLLAAPSQYRNGRSGFQLQQPIPGCLYEIVYRLINTLNQGLLRIITFLLIKTAFCNISLQRKFPRTYRCVR